MVIWVRARSSTADSSKVLAIQNTDPLTELNHIGKVQRRVLDKGLLRQAKAGLNGSPPNTWLRVRGEYYLT